MRPKRLSVIDNFRLEAPFATEFRRLLHKLQQFERPTELKSLLITSAMLSEGKSTVCAYLGITAAVHKGMKTLIVDCDLRRPTMHKMFVLGRKHGMTEILQEGFSPRDAVKKTSVDKLDIITCGEFHAEPTELFDVEAIGTLVDDMKFYYDLILVDAAPALPVSDPMLLAPKLDGALLIVKAGATQKEIVLRALDIVDPLRQRFLGVVLNNMNNTLPYYHDYRYYGYEYRTRKTQEKIVEQARDRRGRKKNPSGEADAPTDTSRSHQK
ncbi:MAG: CpsD/CapB family tyrosine-protein kinase [candidate division Zixibacteria bacterium]|nr:CpsD/CapB family tyrosine-protein kinase [candidate division Zixibacteria bacterium]MDH3939307.1 CpsD/CapB family tyrosine-protein kinase [candidate division Zixibacteria bacterium]MDH4035641.1 CpsD/CapB family tyrosine-protein kinase [candidate division Zixibacteria bacterium]